MKKSGNCLRQNEYGNSHMIPKYFSINSNSSISTDSEVEFKEEIETGEPKSNKWNLWVLIMYILADLSK